MSNTQNVTLQVLATALVAGGVETIKVNLLGGSVAILLGIAVYAIYEFTPNKTA